MKKLRKPIALVFFIVLVFSLTGCTSFDISFESLLAPPKLSELQNKIYTALLSSKGGSIELAYPKSGEYRSAFVIENIDDEATQEAMVFYKSTDADSKTTLRINFLDQDNGEWVSVYDIPAFGAEVESLSFSKIGNSKKINIIISYTLLNQNEHAVSIINYNDRKPIEVYKGTYSYMELLPLPADENELLLIRYDSILGYPVASLLGWDDELFAEHSSVPLNSDAVSFSNASVVDMDGGESAILLDYGKGDNTYSTEILFCYGKILTASGISPDALLRRVNFFTPNVGCMDIDNDGVVEIPSTSVFLGYENPTRTDQINAVIWYTLNGRELEKKYTTFCSPKLDYYFKIPSRWQGLVTVEVTGDETSFSEYIEDGETLIAIRAVEKGIAALPGEWKLFNTDANDKYDYYIKRTMSGNTMALTGAEIEDCICFFNQSA